MLLDIRDAHGYPDKSVSGYIWITDNKFISCIFCVVFQNIYAILQKFCTLIRDIQNISGWTWAYFHYVIPASLWIYDFIWLTCPFSEIILPEMMPYWYPDIYPDNLVSDKRISG